jgi:hypothetical protein
VAITVAWDDEAQTIVRMVLDDTWDLAAFRDASYQCMALIRTVSHPVYVLTYVTLPPSIPYGLLWQLRDLNQMRPPNWGGGIAIARDSFVTTLVATLSQIYMERQKQRLFVVTSEAEGYEIIVKLKQQNEKSSDGTNTT